MQTLCKHFIGVIKFIFTIGAKSEEISAYNFAPSTQVFLYFFTFPERSKISK